MFLVNECPILARAVISGSNAHAGAHWRPAAISSATSPHHPGGSPVIIGNPNPAVKRIEHPAAVVERSPSPRIIRDPCPAHIGITPVAVRIIRRETCVAHRHPHITVTRIVYPCSVGRKLIVKHLHAYAELSP